MKLHRRLFFHRKDQHDLAMGQTPQKREQNRKEILNRKNVEPISRGKSALPGKFVRGEINGHEELGMEKGMRALHGFEGGTLGLM